MDSIGIAAFSHDFETLQGKSSAIMELFDSFGKHPINALDIIVFLFSPIFPLVKHMPGKRREAIGNYRRNIVKIASELFNTLRQAQESGDFKHDSRKSIMGLLSKDIISYCFFLSTISCSAV